MDVIRVKRQERIKWEPPQIVPKNYPCESGVTKAVLFLDFEYVAYGRSDVVRCLDEQPWIDLRWYGAPYYDLFDRWQEVTFDCVAIAVRLIASVMATWPANEHIISHSSDLLTLVVRTSALTWR